MSSIRIDVLNVDETGSTHVAPGDMGRAVIRVHGDMPVVADPSFRIDPIDDALLDDADGGWPGGPRRPIEVCKGEGFTDYVLGPDVLDSPLLESGTPVTISVPGLPGGFELLWPDIAVRGARPRRPVILTEKLRDAERREREAAAFEAEDRRQQAIRLAAEEAEARRREAANLAALRQQQAEGALQRVANGDTTEGATVPLGRRRRGKLVAVESGMNATADHLRLVASDPQPSPSGTELVTRPSSREVARLADNEAAPSKDRIFEGRKSWLAFGAGLGTAMALVAGLTALRVLPFGSGAASTAPPDIALAAARSSGSLRALLATSGSSPRGRTSVGVDATTALALADRHLHGVDLPRDQGEASYWLRHALSQPLDAETMRWSLTQLGTMHAAPDGFEPDYAKARLLWEVASALGDPVAMCFNASLYEYGLGVPKHKSLANALYERARNAGGCPGLDEAVARTK